MRVPHLVTAVDGTAHIHGNGVEHRAGAERLGRDQTGRLGVDAALAWADSAIFDRERRAIEDHVVTVAEVGQLPIGWVETFNDCVEGLYVDPLRITGLGQLLMQHAEKQIREAGFPA